MGVTSREMNRIAGVIDRIVGGLDLGSTDRSLRHLVRTEAQAVLDEVSHKDTQGARRLKASLGRLVALMDAPQTVQATSAHTAKTLFSIKSLIKIFAALTGGALLSLPGLAMAADVGDKIRHPTLNIELTVFEVLPMGVVAIDTSGGEYFVLNIPANGATIVDPLGVPDASGNITTTTTVLGYELENGTIVNSFNIVNGIAVSGGSPVVKIVYGTPANAGDPEIISGKLDVVATLDEPSIKPLPPGSLDIVGSGSNRHKDVQKGDNGNNGRAGALLWGPKSGSAGSTGPDITSTVNLASSVTAVAGPAVNIISMGGNGGDGGSAYLSTSGGASGGQGGNGGAIDATINGGNTHIVTDGDAAHGIFVQSRAGNGGDGGGSWFSGGGTGNGGSSNAGGSVLLVNNVGQINTDGIASHGILAQSLGGGAGDSGSSFGIFTEAGNAGWGGHGGTVNVTSNGNIQTVGIRSYGILAHSVGGQGGDSGASVGIVALGGYAGSAGNGGEVTVTTGANSMIVTEGFNSHAVYAQSVGGGGGATGFQAGLASLGAKAGNGGHGGSVNVHHYGKLSTFNAGAYGILAQSIGGGGGSAGSNFGAVTLGGDGNTGGSAGSVRVETYTGSYIHTTGIGSSGIVAQSIGGGGGDGSTSAGVVSLGGGSASAGNAGQVTVVNRGEVATTQDGAEGIVAQSIGGGGGRGGSTGGFVALGSNGSAGGTSDQVSVTNSGSITTQGSLSRGILAQSIGGGGGTGGSAGGVFASGGGGGQGANSTSRIGSDSSVASDGKAVIVSNTGTIGTKGNLSSGIQAQSIGGGGGDGANAAGGIIALGGSGGGGGAGGAVSVSNSGEIKTQGIDSHGIFAQSIGGGGGNGGSTVSTSAFASIAIGGTGAGGGDGNTVTIKQDTNANTDAHIQTLGDRSAGVMAQSIGGGGGNGGFSISTSVGVFASAGIAIGGDGQGGGEGGTVSYSGYTDITTGSYNGTVRTGQSSNGIVLQSIGGGGGNGGFSIANSVTGLAGASLSLGLGGTGGAGGAGGSVLMNNAGGDIRTYGDFATGLVAQSIGGGGGNGGFSIGNSVMGGAGAAVSATIGGDGLAGGAGGDVNINYKGGIITGGLNAHGALIQSIAGGGGSGGFSIGTSAGFVAAPAVTVGLGGLGGDGSKAGNVQGTITGDILTTGILSSGLVVQSIGGGGGSGGYNVSTAVSGGIGGLGGAVGIGGGKSTGGDGGSATASYTGRLVTAEDYSTGIITQSVGGGGGNGGFNVSAAIGGGIGGLAFTVGLGADGGSGGDGGTAWTTANQYVGTLGDFSSAIVTQSLGGGGGNGAFNVSGGIAGGVGAGAVNVGIGGSGGAGGNGGTARSNIHAEVYTSGTGSTGILTQSIGGGGGSGGYNIAAGVAGGVGAGTINVGIGGTGDNAGNGGLATVLSSQSVRTEGKLSSAIVVQSIGGGGGSGGYNITGGITGGVGSGTVNVGLGGSGGGGGNGGNVDFDMNGTAGTTHVFTKETGSKGVVLQSLGGGGGEGGFSVVGGIGGGIGTGAVSVSLGGNGAGGGNGGTVTADMVGDIVTQGLLSTALLAQSVGGGGGSGGFSIAGGVGVGVGSGAVGVGLGGSGAGGGNGGLIDVTLTGDVYTQKDQANGVVLQSIGGGGGDGGFSIAGGIAGGAVGSGTINVSLGGSAGTGGFASKVEGLLNSTVSTMGRMSTAVTAQSIGGGGGSGGFNIVGGIAGAGVGSGSLSVGLGGAGGGGGNAGAVELTLNGARFIDNVKIAAITSGNLSNGLVAQSIGGGGGSGGFTVTGGIAAAGQGTGAINVGLGGSGGSGGNGSNVDVNVSGAVVTSGIGSTGMILQSIGGGGGSGGFSIEGGVAAAGIGSGSVSVSLGGSGGSGGHAGSVDLTHVGGAMASGMKLAVLTTLKDSTGIVAQSVGGGGGSGGFNISGNVGVGGTGSGSLNVGLGGHGATGGNSSTVSVDIEGMVRTLGNNSRGVVAQSIGGGGGEGGFNINGSMGIGSTGGGAVTVGLGGFGQGGGNAGAVTLKALGGLDLDGKLYAGVTFGNDSTAFTAQSIGGGGGSGAINISGSIGAGLTGSGSMAVGIGGAAGGGGTAGTVKADVTGYVGTAGNQSGGILAQSIGGGGGSGGLNIASGISGSNNAGGNIIVGIGGSGGAGGDGNTVTGIVRSEVLTYGIGSFGLTYQSIGGGGGSGGMNVSSGLVVSKSAAGNVIFGLGGSGSTGGDGGLVDLDFAGSILTNKDYAHGVLLQSAGGGGGSGAMNVSGGVALSKQNAGNLSVGIGGSGSGGGHGGTVIGKLSGTVVTLGNESYGALLQSLGGGGGSGGMNVTGNMSMGISDGVAGNIGFGLGGFGGAGGNGGTVSGNVSGTYWTAGDNAFAVGAQSIGGGGGNGAMNVTGSLAVNKGSVGTVAIGIGGFGGLGGNGGNVSLIRTGGTQTEGRNADGVLIQSLGGGGGYGGINITDTISLEREGTSGTIGFGLGGFGGDGGNAGTVKGTVLGNVWAIGSSDTIWADDIDEDGNAILRRVIADGSNGIVAQSIGGSGGVGGVNSTDVMNLTKGSGTGRAFVGGVGGFGGGGGHGGAVELDVGQAANSVLVRATGDNRSAVIAQSIGGGGGSGGMNLSKGMVSDGSVTLGVGGFADVGGNAGTVTSNVFADLYARGSLSRGLLLQSIGGGGGAGGINISEGVRAKSETSEMNLVFGLGGFGGAGGSAGNVTGYHMGDIFIDGRDAVGALVQSIAGGGGSGGLNVSKQESKADKDSFVISAGIGGSGGASDNAGDVRFTSLGNILVGGAMVANADGDEVFEAFNALDIGGGGGIIVQSIGGGGGAGGINVSEAATHDASPIALGMGGTGGAGGDGGVVIVNRGYDTQNGNAKQAGIILTAGDNAVGILAQSLGGGGGSGGHNLVLGEKYKGSSSSDATAAIIAVGAAGAGAGSGDKVTINHNGTIYTQGNLSAAITAQSIGGGGGNGGYNIGSGKLDGAGQAISLNIGGGTGAGGTGDDVTVNHLGDLQTFGALSYGILAQSIGGGGGNVGVDMATGITADQKLELVIGRSGGTGGAAGKVHVDASGRILTLGENASAIFAQSIGGGGGASGVISASASKKDSGGESLAGNLSVGLEGGKAATGDDVTVDFDGTIITVGEGSRGIFAQSIGGGGGTGGSASASVFMDAKSAAIAIGASGGEGAESGDVRVTNDGAIYTLGGVYDPDVADTSVFGQLASGNSSRFPVGMMLNGAASSDGILAQAIGGGGGLGGSARTTGIAVKNGSSTKSAALTVGGSGGDGAVGGKVTVTNNNLIHTLGDGAFGIRAQSVGGGGGIGGAVMSAAMLGKKENVSLELNIGGSGGVGGAGDLVRVDNNGAIITYGANAAGISANSIGGGGGDAGLMQSLVINETGIGTDSTRAVANIGGSGGQGGTGGRVLVFNNRVGSNEQSGLIYTEGAGSYGILAQSIGGGGGNGSTVIVEQGGATDASSLVIGLTVGGSGGDGENGGEVSVHNSGYIETLGDGAHGILAQSIGGGGGNGGLVVAKNAVIDKSGGAQNNNNTNYDFSLGGFGGKGGDGGSVSVTNTGTIITYGVGANGIQAQSIGGGGGNANVYVGLPTDALGLDIDAELGAVLNGALNTILGGIGLANSLGGTGGDVTVFNSGDIAVFGEGSVGIKAESINGGGGLMKFDINGLLALPQAPVVDPGGASVIPDTMLFARMGSEASTDMNAGKVVVNNFGNIYMQGDAVAASLSQAIGGGGGDMKMNVRTKADLLNEAHVPLHIRVALGGVDGDSNSGDDLNLIFTGQTGLVGDYSTAVLGQSIGGGGGRLTINLDTDETSELGVSQLVFGAENTLNEEGGDIVRDHTGNVDFEGALSQGTLLQSIGGGGGSTTLNLNGNHDGFDASFGSQGGLGAHGGLVEALYAGSTVFAGDHAVGMSLQSIGAGGGMLRVGNGANGTVTLGGTDGIVGDGGDITLLKKGNIYGEGISSHGLLLQSIGGGGGAVLGNGEETLVTLSTGGAGDGGAISFEITGNIALSGGGNYGVIAQSLGGGGGWVDGVFAGSAGGAGSGGAIDLTLGGTVLTTGADSVAVFAQSDGKDGAGDITLMLNDLVRGGTGTGAGIRLAGGANNAITSQISLSSVNGWAIQAGTGNDHITNNGFIVGNVDLAGGDNRITNSLGATFLTFDTLRLNTGNILSVPIVAGGAGAFTNSGLLRLGLEASPWPIDLLSEDFANVDDVLPAAQNLYYGARVVSVVDLDGHFVQSDTGRAVFDVAFGPYQSDRLNVTGSALVAGNIDVTLTWLENINPVTLIATGGSADFTGVEPADTLALDYSIKADAAGVHLLVESDFGLDFLRPNEELLGHHMDSALQVGGASGIGRLLAALGNMVAGQEDLYQAIFTELNPEGHIAPLQTQYYGATRFADQMFDCGLMMNLALDRCVWGKASTTAFDQEETQDYWGATSRVFNARAGVEKRLNTDWVGSLSAGYTTLTRQNVDGARMYTESDGFDAGLGLSRMWNQKTELRLTATAGWQWMDTRRQGYVFEVMEGHADGESGYLQLGAELGHTLRSGSWHFRPALNLLGTALRNGDYEEIGWDGLGARIVGDTQYIASIEPKLTTGVEFGAGQGVRAGLWLTAGFVHRSEDAIYLPVQLIGASEASDPARLSTPLDRNTWNVGFLAKFDTDIGVSFHAGYEGQIGDKTEVHTGSVSVRWNF